MGEHAVDVDNRSAEETGTGTQAASPLAGARRSKGKLFLRLGICGTDLCRHPLEADRLPCVGQPKSSVPSTMARGIHDGHRSDQRDHWLILLQFVTFS